MKPTYFYITILTLLLGTSYALAGGKEAGNGGGGVLEEGKPYLLDLVESGIEKAPFFDTTVEADPVYKARVAQAFSSLPDTPNELVSQKLTEISHLDQVLAASLMKVMELYFWKPIDFTLVHIPDEETVIDIDPSLQVQLAARLEHSIEINAMAWEQLDQANKAALIFHEALYALLVPDQVTTATGVTYYQQSSPRAREIVGYLFSSISKIRGSSGLHQLIGSSLPNKPETIIYVSWGYQNPERCAWIAGSLYCGYMWNVVPSSPLITVTGPVIPQSYCANPATDAFTVQLMGGVSADAALTFATYTSPDLQTHMYIQEKGLFPLASVWTSGIQKVVDAQQCVNTIQTLIEDNQSQESKFTCTDCPN